MASETHLPDFLNGQQLMMLRLLKNPLPEKDFQQIRRLAVKLLSQHLDEVLNENCIRFKRDCFCIGPKSKLRRLWESFLAGKYQIVISKDIIKEYEEILQKYSAPGAAQLILELFIESPDIIQQAVYYNWHAITVDPDDDKFFDIAVAANVDYLVTNDRHFK